MSDSSLVNQRSPLRIGAVSYLNSRPLIRFLPQSFPGASIDVDLPSRLADRLAAGRLDVALIPSIEYFRNPGYTVVSDACIASDGAVRSVKLYSRVPVRQIRTLALDEGSRTSAALTRILLKERYALEPSIELLSIGATVDDSASDAVMLVGDRGMVAPDGPFHTIWDLGEEWRNWTELPFVFAMWVAGPRVDLGELAEGLATARDEGIRQYDRIAREESPKLGIAESECVAYFRDNLRFVLGSREREGLRAFCRLAAISGLISEGVQLVFADRRSC